MTRSKPTTADTVCCRRRNFLAILISFAAISFLYFNFEPTPVGAEGNDPRIDLASLAAAVPMPVVAPEPPAEEGSGSQHDAGSPDDGSASQVGAQSGVLRGRLAVLMNLLLLEKGYDDLSKVSDYTATFFKQELVDGVMGEGQVMFMKLRHEPFSVYLKWLVGDKGREVLYVSGENDGNMIVRAGGLKGRLLPALKLNPRGSIALGQSRHPITNIGLLNLAARLIGSRKSELGRNLEGVHCYMLDDQLLGDRPCYCFVLNFESPQDSEVYRKSIQYVDKELSLPVCIRNYGWPAETENIPSEELDERTLIEFYSYSDVQLNRQLADADFDRANKNYHFRR